MSEELVSNMPGTQEAAQMLGIHYKTLLRWAKTGHIKKFEYPEGVFRFPRAEIARLRKNGVEA